MTMHSTEGKRLIREQHSFRGLKQAQIDETDAELTKPGYFRSLKICMYIHNTII